MVYYVVDNDRWTVIAVLFYVFLLNEISKFYKSMKLLLLTFVIKFIAQSNIFAYITLLLNNIVL